MGFWATKQHEDHRINCRGTNSNETECTSYQKIKTNTEEKWQIVEFPKKKNQQKRHINANTNEDSDISVDIYHAETGKYLDS